MHLLHLDLLCALWTRNMIRESLKSKFAIKVNERTVSYFGTPWHHHEVLPGL